MENQNQDLPPNVSDHDLLIVLHTTMKHMSRDITSIKDDSAKRLAVVESIKYDKEDAFKALNDASKVHDELGRKVEACQLKTEAAKIQETNDKLHGDHEVRMRRMEKNMYIAIGGLALLQIILAFAK
jgi:hypothetical protein